MSSDPSGVSAYVSHLDKAVDRTHKGPLRSPTPRELRLRAEEAAALAAAKEAERAKPSLANAMERGESVFVVEREAPGLVPGLPVGGRDRVFPCFAGLTAADDSQPHPSGRRHVPEPGAKQGGSEEQAAGASSAAAGGGGSNAAGRRG